MLSADRTLKAGMHNQQLQIGLCVLKGCLLFMKQWQAEAFAEKQPLVGVGTPGRLADLMR
jgi:hypothetical protein